MVFERVPVCVYVVVEFIFCLRVYVNTLGHIIGVYVFLASALSGVLCHQSCGSFNLCATSGGIVLYFGEEYRRCTAPGRKWLPLSER